MQYFDPLSLKLFIAICEQQSLTEAAEREHLTVSAVSKRLAALEEQIGAPLLDRGRGGIHLTSAGEALLPSARGLLQSMARIQANLSAYAQSTPGTVRVAAVLSALTWCLPDDIAAFSERHAHVAVHLEERSGPEVVTAVEQGRVDIGVCWDMTETRRLQTEEYRLDHLVVVVHPQHELAHHSRLSFADTLPYDRIMVDAGSIGLHLQQRMAIAEGKALKTPVHVRTYETACHVAAANLGIAIVPREATRALADAFGLRMIHLSDDWAKRRIVLCVRDHGELGMPARLLLEALALH